MEDVNESSRTELDSHANMVVIGMKAYILSTIGETVDVAHFTPDYKPISVELVDAALKYECPYCGEIKILIIRRGLHVPSMQLYSKKPIFEFLCHCMAHSLIFSQASQVSRNWSNQRMYIS